MTAEQSFIYRITTYDLVTGKTISDEIIEGPNADKIAEGTLKLFNIHGENEGQGISVKKYVEVSLTD